MTIKELKEVLSRYDENCKIFSRVNGFDEDLTNDCVYYDAYNLCVIIEPD